MESLDNFTDRFDLIQGNRIVFRREIQKSPNGVGIVGMIDDGAVGFKFFIIAFPDSLLKQYQGFGIIQMILTVRAASQGVKSRRIQRGVHRKAQGIKGAIMAISHISFNVFNLDAADLRSCSHKIFICDVLTETDRFKNTRRLIRLKG